MSDRPAIAPAVIAAVDAAIVPALQPAVAAALPAAVQCPHAHLRSDAGSTGSLGQAKHVDSHLQTHHGKPHHPRTHVQADHPFSHVQAGDHPVSHVLALGRTIGRTIGSTGTINHPPVKPFNQSIGFDIQFRPKFCELIDWADSRHDERSLPFSTLRTYPHCPHTPFTHTIHAHNPLEYYGWSDVRRSREQPVMQPEQSLRT
jgi:hypothetical protein